MPDPEVATLILDGPKCRIDLQRVVVAEEKPMRLKSEICDMDGRRGMFYVDLSLDVIINQGILPALSGDELLDLRRKVDEELTKRERKGR